MERRMERMERIKQSTFLDNLRPPFCSNDEQVKQDASWQRFQRRIQSGDFGISLQTALPQIVTPAFIRREKLVKQALLTLSDLSLEVNVSREVLMKSTTGLIDPNSQNGLNVDDFVRSDTKIYESQNSGSSVDEDVVNLDALYEAIFRDDSETSTGAGAGFVSSEETLPSKPGNDIYTRTCRGGVRVVDTSSGMTDADEKESMSSSSENCRSTTRELSSAFTSGTDTQAEIVTSLEETGEGTAEGTNSCNDVGDVVLEEANEIAEVDEGFDSKEDTSSVQTESTHESSKLQDTTTRLPSSSDSMDESIQEELPFSHEDISVPLESVHDDNTNAAVTDNNDKHDDDNNDNHDDDHRQELSDDQEKPTTSRKYRKRDANNSGDVTLPDRSQSGDSHDQEDQCLQSSEQNTATTEVTPAVSTETSETTPEATVYTTPEATVETTPEATVDTTPEATVDTTPEATVDTTPEATVDTTPEATVETTLDNRIDKAEEFKHYKMFIEVEKLATLKRLAATKKHLIADLTWKQRVIDDMMEVAKAYYSNPTGPARNKWKKLRRKIGQDRKDSLTDTMVKVSMAPQYIPFFTCAMVFVQITFMVYILIARGMAPIGVVGKLELQKNTRTFLGRETVDTWLEVNMWLGPTSAVMSEMGAVLGLCMRDDAAVHMQASSMNYSRYMILGCCEVSARNTAGTTTEDECSPLVALGIGRWTRGVPCSQRLPQDTSVMHVMRPCCVDHMATCVLVSNEHCTFLKGIFITSNEHCSQVNCANWTCKMGGISSDEKSLWQPTSYQWWRPLVSLVLSHGTIHQILLLTGETALLNQVELTAGWLRMAILYVVCGVAGGMCASVFSPYRPQVCTSAAVMGFLGVLHTELLEGWKVITKPWLELVKIYLVLAFALLSGSLPNISNAAILMGFVTGMVAAVIVLPHVTLRLWFKMAKVTVVTVAVCVLVLLYAFVFYSFHYVQGLHQCAGCHRFDCVNYVSNMCYDDN